MRAAGDYPFDDRGPWYRTHPVAALMVAGVLFASVAAVQLIDTTAGDASSLLYALPISLMAVTFGVRGGVAAAAVGYALFAAFAVLDTTGAIGVGGWTARAVAMLTLGALLGRASDQTAAACRAAFLHQRDSYELRDANRRYAEAIEISDSVLQHVAAAKWMIEQGRSEEAIPLLKSSMGQGQRMVADLLPRVTRHELAQTGACSSTANHVTIGLRRWRRWRREDPRARTPFEGFPLRRPATRRGAAPGGQPGSTIRS